NMDLCGPMRVASVNGKQYILVIVDDYSRFTWVKCLRSKEDNHDIEVAHMGNDPYFGIPIPEVPSDQSSSTDSIHTIMHPDH
ncbi:retrovirus-related pol polyprotein from transposon TNT 1-94, partial [Tanacetum coccineum]